MQTCKGSDRLKSTTLIFTSQGGQYITVLCSAEIDLQGSDGGGGGLWRGMLTPNPLAYIRSLLSRLSHFPSPVLAWSRLRDSMGRKIEKARTQCLIPTI